MKRGNYKVNIIFQVHERVPLLQHRRRAILYTECKPDNLRVQKIMLASDNQSGCLQEESRLTD